MYDVLRFWLDRGVDGFRVDVLWLLIKDEQFRDNPENPNWQPHQRGIEQQLQRYSADRPETLEVVEEMRAVLDGYADRVLIGEIYLPVERLVAYYGRDMKGAQLPFNFQLIFAAWNAPAIARIVADYEAALPVGGWPNWVLGNHDQKRIATRVGSAQAPVAAMLLLTLRGTPTLYYGDELGLQDVPIPSDRAQDPWARNEPGLGLGRDPARTPMPWNDLNNAGFTAGVPWLPLNADCAVRNVATLAADPRSILALYGRLIALRRQRPALHSGAYIAVHTEGDVLAFERRHEQDAPLLVALNLGSSTQQIPLPSNVVKARLLLSTELDRDGEAIDTALTLRPSEGLIVELDALAGSAIAAV
jgi:alpha-glucosidase